MNKALKILAIAMTLSAAPAVMGAEAQMPAAAEAQLTLEASEAVVKGGQGKVAIDVPQPQSVAVYSITGKMVKEFQADAGHYDIELPKGCYIVRVGSHTVKIVVK